LSLSGKARGCRPQKVLNRSEQREQRQQHGTTQAGTEFSLPHQHHSPNSLFPPLPPVRTAEDFGSCRVNPGSFLSPLVLAVLVFGSSAARADWPEFRGPSGDGRASGSNDTKAAGFPLHWSETDNVRWKTEIPYRGWS